MPSKKKKYNARFPAGRIKKIMQTDEEVGKVAQAVPVIISRTLELFVESLLTKAMQITSAKNAKTLSPSHMKQCILSESRFDFLKDLVKSLPDASSCDSEEGVSSNVSSPQPYSGPSNSVDSISSRRPSEGLPTYPSWTLPGNVNTTESSVSSPTTQLHPNFYKENSEANTSFTQISPEFMPRSTVLCSNSPTIPQTENNRSLLHHHSPSVIQTVSVLKKVDKETYSTGNMLSKSHVNSVQTIAEDMESNSLNSHSSLIIPQYVNTDSIVVDEDYDT